MSLFCTRRPKSNYRDWFAQIDTASCFIEFFINRFVQFISRPLSPRKSSFPFQTNMSRLVSGICNKIITEQSTSMLISRVITLSALCFLPSFSSDSTHDFEGEGGGQQGFRNKKVWWNWLSQVASFSRRRQLVTESSRRLEKWPLIALIVEHLEHSWRASNWTFGHLCETSSVQINFSRQKIPPRIG